MNGVQAVGKAVDQCLAAEREQRDRNMASGASPAQKAGATLRYQIVEQFVEAFALRCKALAPLVDEDTRYFVVESEDLT